MMKKTKCLIFTLVLVLVLGLIPTTNIQAAGMKKLQWSNIDGTQKYYGYLGTKKRFKVASVSKSGATTVISKTASKSKLVWKSSNKKIATVDATGAVTFKKCGKATIVCKSKKNAKVKVSVVVRVIRPATKVKFKTNSKSIYAGRTYKQTPSVGPSNATSKAVIYTSSNKAIATVASDGTVKGISAGTATIKAKAKYGTGTAKYTIKVYEPIAHASDDTSEGARVIAHRGMNTLAPENTVAAFELAGQEEYWGIETDVRITSDGNFVLQHDRSMGRTCGSKYNAYYIDKLTLEKVRKIPITIGSNVSKYANASTATAKAKGTRVPILKEFLDVCAASGKHPVIELKWMTTNEDMKISTAAYEGEASELEETTLQEVPEGSEPAVAEASEGDDVAIEAVPVEEEEIIVGEDGSRTVLQTVEKEDIVKLYNYLKSYKPKDGTTLPQIVFIGFNFNSLKTLKSLDDKEGVLNAKYQLLTQGEPVLKADGTHEYTENSDGSKTYHYKALDGSKSQIIDNAAKKVKTVQDANGKTKTVVEEYDRHTVKDALDAGFDLDLNYTYVSTDVMKKLQSYKKADGTNVEVNLWTMDGYSSTKSYVEAGAEYITTNKKFW